MMTLYRESGHDLADSLYEGHRAIGAGLDYATNWMQSSILMRDRSFRDTYDFADRSSEASRVRMKYPGRIPVVLERHHGSSEIPKDSKKKFLIPGTMSMSEFLFVIRRRIKLDETKAIFIYVDSQLVPMSQPFEHVYAKHKDDDGFLYLQYSGENVFGG